MKSCSVEVFFSSRAQTNAVPQMGQGRHLASVARGLTLHPGTRAVSDRVAVSLRRHSSKSVTSHHATLHYSVTSHMCTCSTRRHRVRGCHVALQRERGGGSQPGPCPAVTVRAASSLVVDVNSPDTPRIATTATLWQQQALECGANPRPCLLSERRRLLSPPPPFG